MGFVKTMDKIAANHRETGDFYDAEVLRSISKQSRKLYKLSYRRL